MIRKNKSIYPLVSLALVSVLVGTSMAQDESSHPTLALSIDNLSANSTIIPSQSVQIALEERGFSFGSLDKNPTARTLWSKLYTSFEKNGVKADEVLLANDRVQTIVELSAWPEGKPFLKEGQTPAVWKNLDLGLLDVSKEFKFHREQWDDLTAAEKTADENYYSFLRFHDKRGGDDFRTALICSALPYAAEVKKTLIIPAELEPLRRELCKDNKSRIYQLTYSVNDWGTPDNQPPRSASAPQDPLSAGVVLHSSAFASEFVAFRMPFEKICGANALSDSRIKNSLIKAKWIDNSLIPTAPGVEIALGDATTSCSQTIREKLIPLLSESLNYYAKQGRFVADNAWLNTQLKGLATARQDEWISAKDITQKIIKDLASEFTVANGFTDSPLVLHRDLNAGALISVVQEGEELKYASLLAALLQVDEKSKKSSPWYKALEKLSNADRETYLSRMLKAVTVKCQGKVETECVAESLGAFDSIENTPLIQITIDGKVVLKKYGLTVPD